MSAIRWGIYKAMQGVGPMTSQELADKTGLNERYVREWLKAMVAAGISTMTTRRANLK
ncbi:MAG: winged helix-turn-helix domain-containing protein [Bryobacterales bacterium]